ncbi:hypothetical protein L226DRAFT_616524 [Lentinus tigrinus ALCF2SS1-7]|uniref:Fungal-type protein kinase domain-containing protein n=1 Tax=Lentinus tigrinus ALCF2SS1-6 TaxID=1328759 RepID=A0A5C2RT16_9APHY|nr:hypothetical protein L227DRAFT_337981 [Lentinus tigrinus ALCF2SS1-6]RPD69940.1 hypothetical protein L226DRAFT_616524 [Lentinus tigrinus ALCF2SS1-7]
MSSSTACGDWAVHEPTEIQALSRDDEHVERTGTWSYSFAPDPLPDLLEDTVVHEVDHHLVSIYWALVWTVLRNMAHRSSQVAVPEGLVNQEPESSTSITARRLCWLYGGSTDESNVLPNIPLPQLLFAFADVVFNNVRDFWKLQPLLRRTSTRHDPGFLVPSCATGV